MLKVLAALFLTVLPLMAEPRILAGPDVLVGGSEHPQVEMMVAAHPGDPGKLVAGTMALGSATGTLIYSSADRGATWQPAFPEGRVPGGGDPVVVYSPRGTALFAELANVPEVDGRQAVPIAVYRSEDGGRVWQKPVLLGNNAYDHPQIAVDPRSGRVYLSTLLWAEGYQFVLGLFRSDDDGRTFTGPVHMVRARGDETGVFNLGLGVFSDGTLVHVYIESAVDPAKDKEAKLWAAASRDGGETFSAPVLAATMGSPPRNRMPDYGTFPQVAVDAGRGRLYLVWGDFRGSLPQVLLAASGDQGKTWSEPRAVAGPLPQGAHTFQPAVAVNPEGVVGVSWLDSRNHPGTARYDAYFTASLDAGATFLPPARLSSESSDILGAGNQHPRPSTWRAQKVLRLSFLNALTRYSAGGDYAGLAADAGGDFHPLWPDARSGRFQVWTARVRVERNPAPPAPAAAAATDITDLVELIADPASYDPETREMRLPIRLRNRSDKVIRGPLQARVKTFGSGRGEMYKENAPALLNAANGQPGDGAVFDYGKALGDFETLPPGAVTESVVWRFKAGSMPLPDMHVEVTGRADP